MFDDLNAEVDRRCNCLALRKAARYLTAAYDRALTPTRLRATQFAILSRLARHGPIAIKRLAESIAMDRTTLATNLKPLQRSGLVESCSAKDARVRLMGITDLGRERLAEALPLWAGVQHRFETAYGAAEAAALRASLGAVLGTGFEPWAE